MNKKNSSLGPATIQNHHINHPKRLCLEQTFFQTKRTPSYYPCFASKSRIADI